MNKRRKHPLLKNEINMIQNSLLGEVTPTFGTRVDLVKRLEELKKQWYKV